MLWSPLIAIISLSSLRDVIFAVYTCSVILVIVLGGISIPFAVIESIRLLSLSPIVFSSASTMTAISLIFLAYDASRDVAPANTDTFVSPSLSVTPILARGCSSSFCTAFLYTSASVFPSQRTIASRCLSLKTMLRNASSRGFSWYIIVFLGNADPVPGLRAT